MKDLYFDQKKDERFIEGSTWFYSKLNLVAMWYKFMGSNQPLCKN